MGRVAWGAELCAVAERHSSRIAVRDGEGAASYREVFDHAAGIAAWLAETGRLERPIATSLRNSRRAVAASYAVALAGGCEAPINPHLSLEDVRYCVELSGAGTVLADSDRLPALRSVGLDAVEVTSLPPRAIEQLPQRSPPGEAWGRISFTSGTTGRPKGIVHTHEARWIGNILMRANLPIAATPGRNILLVTPFAHGASLLTFAFLDGGAAVTLLDGVDPRRVAAVLRNGEADQIFAPPTVLAKVVPPLKGARIDTVDAIFTGTAPLDPELYRETRSIFGPVVRVTYGKTEIFNPITVLTPTETEAWYREAQDGAQDGASMCVGWPASGVELLVLPDASLSGPDREAVGPVLLRARHMFAGVLVDGRFEPQDPGDYHRTGDLGFVDRRGRLHLIGRESEIIKTGGYSVAPEEVDRLIGPLAPGLDVAVVGLPSAYWGEIITAAAAASGPDWAERVAGGLSGATPYKRPRLFATVPEIPRNATGKVVRARLREAILAAYAVEDGPHPRLRALPSPGV